MYKKFGFLKKQCILSLQLRIAIFHAPVVLKVNVWGCAQSPTCLEAVHWLFGISAGVASSVILTLAP